jgi:hypothetical protein
MAKTGGGCDYCLQKEKRQRIWRFHSITQKQVYYNITGSQGRFNAGARQRSR